MELIPGKIKAQEFVTPQHLERNCKPSTLAIMIAWWLLTYNGDTCIKFSGA